MGKAAAVSQTEKEDGPRRRSLRVKSNATAPKPARAAETKKKPAAAAKKVTKPKKAKQAENGNPKTEEPKAEATEAK